MVPAVEGVGEVGEVGMLEGLHPEDRREILAEVAQRMHDRKKRKKSAKKLRRKAREEREEREQIERYHTNLATTVIVPPYYPMRTVPYGGGGGVGEGLSVQTCHSCRGTGVQHTLEAPLPRHDSVGSLLP